MDARCLFFALLLAITSNSASNAFSEVARNCRKLGIRQYPSELFSTPPPLSPLSNDENYNYDNYTPAEVTQMQDVIVSLSEETNDEARRNRLRAIVEVALAGPNGGPKRFAVLFERVLTQVGQQVQDDAREKHSQREAASDAEGDGATDENAETVAESEGGDGEVGEAEDKKPREKSPEELKLWALVDMMIQSKTMLKKHNF